VTRCKICGWKLSGKIEDFQEYLMYAAVFLYGQISIDMQWWEDFQAYHNLKELVAKK